VEVVTKVRKEIQHLQMSLFPPEIGVITGIKEKMAAKVSKDWKEGRVFKVYRDIQVPEVTLGNV
jgi:hypothetical protein